MSRKLKILTAVTILVFLTGVGFLCFPPVSNCVGKNQAENVARNFDDTKKSTAESVRFKNKKITSVEQLSEKEKKEYRSMYSSQDVPVVLKKDIKRLKEDSEKYNKKLLTTQGTKAMIGYEKPALNLRKYGIYNGVYCYISAPSIGLKLPVYLGSSETKMSWGAAHMFGTSLPIGGQTTNSGIAGHTGYIGRIFFDNIRSLKKGSDVIVTTYWNKITYKVTGTTVIKPNELSSLELKDNHQLLELLTCIDNGKGGFNRFVVICERK